jgi:hypothetical protein
MAQFPVNVAPVPAACAQARSPPFDPRSSHTDGVLMTTALFHLSTVAVLAVLAVLLLGLWNMIRGTSPNTSQKLMRWRVGLQFLAILVIMAFFLLTR